MLIINDYKKQIYRIHALIMQSHIKVISIFAPYSQKNFPLDATSMKLAPHFLKKGTFRSECITKSFRVHI